MIEMDESEDNMSVEDTEVGSTSSSIKSKQKKRSLVERELETNLTAHVTSPVTISEAFNTSRYGRALRLKTGLEMTDSEKILKCMKTPAVERTPTKIPLSPVYKMHASNSPIKGDMLVNVKSFESILESQIENIYSENKSFSHFDSTEKKKSSPANFIPKLYVRKDLIQNKVKDKSDLSKNIYSSGSAKKSKNSHLQNILERSSEKYNINSGKKVIKSDIKMSSSSVVKTLDFDNNKNKRSSSNKISVSKSDMFELEAKCEFQVGDLAWARMGTYPFWPCIVTREPSSGIFVRKKLFGRVEHDIIHVTFFGDNGRRSWMVDSMLRKFLGQLEFEATREHFSFSARKKDPKLYAAFFISEKKMPQWSISVEEAETLLREPKRLRIDIFNDMLAKSRNAKLMKPKSANITRTGSDVSLSESLYDTLFSENNRSSEDLDSSRSKTRKSLDVSEVVTACLDNMAAKSGITKIQKQSHMDRWLQKAKSKTPEKSQVKLLVPLKEKEKSINSKKKKWEAPKNVLKKPYSLRKSHESQNLMSHHNEHDYSSKNETDVIPGITFGIITKVESLRDKVYDEIDNMQDKNLGENEINVCESPTFTQDYEEVYSHETEQTASYKSLDTPESVQDDSGANKLETLVRQECLQDNLEKNIHETLNISELVHEKAEKNKNETLDTLKSVQDELEIKKYNILDIPESVQDESEKNIKTLDTPKSIQNQTEKNTYKMLDTPEIVQVESENNKIKLDSPESVQNESEKNKTSLNKPECVQDELEKNKYETLYQPESVQVESDKNKCEMILSELVQDDLEKNKEESMKRQPDIKDTNVNDTVELNHIDFVSSTLSLPSMDKARIVRANNCYNINMDTNKIGNTLPYLDMNGHSEENIHLDFGLDSQHCKNNTVLSISKNAVGNAELEKEIDAPNETNGMKNNEVALYGQEKKSVILQCNGLYDLNIPSIEKSDTETSFDNSSQSTEESDITICSSAKTRVRSSAQKKRSLRLKKQSKQKSPNNQDDAFAKYVKLHKDELIDEHPHLSEKEIMDYLFKTWQYQNGDNLNARVLSVSNDNTKEVGIQNLKDKIDNNISKTPNLKLNTAKRICVVNLTDILLQSNISVAFKNGEKSCIWPINEYSKCTNYIETDEKTHGIDGAISNKLDTDSNGINACNINNDNVCCDDLSLKVSLNGTENNCTINDDKMHSDISKLSSNSIVNYVETNTNIDDKSITNILIVDNSINGEESCHIRECMHNENSKKGKISVVMNNEKPAIAIDRDQSFDSLSQTSTYSSVCLQDSKLDATYSHKDTPYNEGNVLRSIDEIVIDKLSTKPLNPNLNQSDNFQIKSCIDLACQDVSKEFRINKDVTELSDLEISQVNPMLTSKIENECFDNTICIDKVQSIIDINNSENMQVEKNQCSINISSDKEELDKVCLGKEQSIVSNIETEVMSSKEEVIINNNGTEGISIAKEQSSNVNNNEIQVMSNSENIQIEKNDCPKNISTGREDTNRECFGEELSIVNNRETEDMSVSKEQVIINNNETEGISISNEQISAVNNKETMEMSFSKKQIVINKNEIEETSTTKKNSIMNNEDSEEVSIGKKQRKDVMLKNGIEEISIGKDASSMKTNETPSKSVLEHVKLNGFYSNDDYTPNVSEDEFNAETASIYSEDSEPLAIIKNKLQSKNRYKIKDINNPDFIKYKELHQDALMDEHPELSYDELVDYMHKTWLYEENSKSDFMKTDSLEQSGIVKGLNDNIKQKTIRNHFRVSKKRKLRSSYEDSISISSDISDFSVKRNTRQRFSQSPVVTMENIQNDISKESSVERRILEREESESVNSDFSDKCDVHQMHNKIPKPPKTSILCENNLPNISLTLENQLENTNDQIKQKEEKVVSEGNYCEKTKYFSIFNKSESEHKIQDIHSECDFKVKQEYDPETVSINSEDSAVSLSKRKHRTNQASKDNPEFCKYLELRQDALIDENPELSQEEIISYLYKTWLYEESVKSDIKKIDEIEQASMIKGLNTDIAKPKKVRKKMNTEKELTADEDTLQNDKPKRKNSHPYYIEDELSDSEDIEVFDIFKSKQRLSTDDIDNINVDDDKDDGIDEVELYFNELTKPKPNVFKGLVREKVCEICERTSNLVKCKGCNCMFHVECVKKETEVKVELPVPTRGRKKKKKLGRKPKNLDESGSHSDEKSQDVSAENNVSVEDMVELESYTVDAENFESVLEVKMKELIPMTENCYSYATYDGINWNGTIAGKCEIVDFKLTPKIETDYSDFKCRNCQQHAKPVCFVCKSVVSKTGVEYRQRCQIAHCYKYYHMECLDHWPQTQFHAGELSKIGKKIDERFEEFMCPRHVCHTCVSDDPRGCKTRFSGDKLARCIRCPATYHSFTKCLPAGSQILTASHIVCPRHYEHRPGKVPCHVNTGWCFICALGGSLICCEYCPTSFHAECLNIKPPEGGYMCEDCETGRLPLYGEMVWVKLGHYRWWPGMILHPSEIPDNIMAVKHSPGEFVVRFFGQYDHYWVNRGRVFPFQEGDSGRISSQKSKIDAAFTMAMEHAQRACKILKSAETNEEEDTDIASSLLPPHYVKLKVNKPVGSVCSRRVDVQESSLTQCDCNPDVEDPCGPYSHCLNRMLLTECGPSCRAGDRCNNRAFEKRQYPRVAPYRTPQRGWGLRALEDIKAGQFVIEYVGELIDEEEFKRRMNRKHEIRDENFYFLTLDKERMIDAGPKGNLARFMNHCCEPNCETQKWTVLGDVRVGLFAIKDIPAKSELTFNYNLECAGIEKKRCLCGAKRCSGYMGAKPKQDEQPKKPKRTYKKRKPTEESPSTSKNKPKRSVGRPAKPRELTEIEKDLLIIKNATNGLSSDSECSGRVSGVETDRNAKALKRKRVSFSTEDSITNNSSPTTKKAKLDDEKVLEVGD
ncbi:unnamed protein product [Diatraea saccharalis]|uniref:Uncharacterized protein n=1 Tax=Diatraea saccharalis TaxID=40085 RepID=A0A9P0G2U6_9NEOP|nr:unnamed protein product [Diatraea saccharalis]